MIENAHFDDDFPFFVYKMYTQCNKKTLFGFRYTLSGHCIEKSGFPRVFDTCG